jgi:hypothetical protein
VAYIFHKKMRRPKGCGKRRLVEKSKTRTFPPSLEIQQKTLDYHFSHSPDGCWMLFRQYGEK